MNNINDISIFESIKHYDNNGHEYWFARELQIVLGYTKWQNFEKVIDKARLACQNSKIVEKDRFTDVSKTVSSGVADIPVKDIVLFH